VLIQGSLPVAAIEGALRSFEFDSLAMYFFPSRIFESYGYTHILREYIVFVPALLLALGGMSAAARNGIPRGFMFIGVTIPATLPLLPVHAGLSGIRFLFLPSSGICLILASLVAGAPFGPRVRWGCIAVLALFMLSLESSNFVAWDRSRKQLEHGASEVGRAITAAVPQPNSVFVVGLPDVIESIPCFINSYPHLMQRALNRPQLDVGPPEQSIGPFDSMIEYDSRKGIARETTHPTPARHFALGDRLVVDFRKADDFNYIRIYNVNHPLQLDRGLIVIADNPNSSILFDAIGVPPNSRLIVKLSGEWLNRPLDTKPIPVFIIAHSATGILRTAALGGVYEVPADVSAITIEVRPQPEPVRITGVSIEVIPR
jgi:hypothetical protein